MSDVAAPGLLDRAIRRITNVWREMAAGVEDESIAAQMRACLEGRGGEVSARNRAAKLAETYQGLDEAGRKDFLRALAGFDSRCRRRGHRLCRGAGGRRPGRPRHRQGGAAPRPGTAAAAAADALHRHPGRTEIPGRSARLPAARAQRRQAAGGAGSRSARPARRLVRHRLSRAATHRLVEPRFAAGEAGRLRGGA